MALVYGGPLAELPGAVWEIKCACCFKVVCTCSAKEAYELLHLAEHPILCFACEDEIAKIRRAEKLDKLTRIRAGRQ
jgi:hypothetical protein